MSFFSENIQLQTEVLLKKLLLQLCFSMAYIINNKLACFMFFLFASSYLLGDTFTDGRRIEPMKNTGLIKRKGTIKTIEVIMSAKCIFFFFLFFLIKMICLI